jgi:CBS domain-containing protein
METTVKRPASRLMLRANCVEDLMTPNPLSISHRATVRQAAGILLDKGISAAPVIDDAGRPVGVVSRTDVLAHHRATVPEIERIPAYFVDADMHLPNGEKLREGFQVENVDYTRVEDIMTPIVFAVAPEKPVWRAVEDMVGHHIHRVFVVDRDGVLVGVVSALDILRYISPTDR